MSANPKRILTRPAKTRDVAWIMATMQPLVQKRVLLGKDPAVVYAAVPEFRMAETEDGTVIGCGALHVFWEDLGEIRTLLVLPEWRGRGAGRALVESLEDHARYLGIRRLFCLTFETTFFSRLGFRIIGEESAISTDVYQELLLSPDEGVAEFLNLSRVKPNTLGNTRMLKTLPAEA